MHSGDEIQAGGSYGVLIGSHSTQINNYYYGRTATDGVAPPPLVTVSGEIESPYRGLAAFEERDAAFYYGRETAATELLVRMSRLLGEGRLLVVSGVSGAGKSSLLRAGVLPRIRSTGLAGAPQARDWPCLVFTPGAAPLNELATRTAALAGIDAVAVRGSLEWNPAAFALTARQAALRQSADRLLLIVDQFEQVFRSPEPEQRAFITALHAAATVGHDAQQVPAALVVLVVRADFEARCADHPLLTTAIQDRYLVTVMTRRQLRLAITEPALKTGAGVEEALVEILLDEVNGAGALPLLSHALDQAWRRRHGPTLTVVDYERTGGVEGAIAASAQSSYERLSPRHREVAREVFIRLSAISGDGTDIARRASRGELFDGKTQSQIQEVNAVLESFAAERLLTLAAHTVEISHEILLRAWPLLRDEWLAETRSDRLIRTRLSTRTVEWAGDNRDSSYLYRGTVLLAAKDMAARVAVDFRRHPPLSRDEQEFLLASRRLQRRGVRRRQGFTALLMVLVLGLALIAVVAYRASDEAVHQRDVAAANQVAVQSANVDEPVLSRLESVAAWRISPTPESRYAMKVAAARADMAVLSGHSGWVMDGVFTPDGRTLASVGDDNTIRLWDVATHRQIGDAFSTDVGSVDTVAVTPDGKTLATGGSDDAVHLWDVASHRAIATLPVGVKNINSVEISPDGRLLANSNGDGSLLLWDMATRQQVARFAGHPGDSPYVLVTFSPDSRTLASVGNDGTIRLWDTATHRELGDPLIGHTEGPTSVEFSPDGTTLATAGETVRLWDIAAHRQLAALPTDEGVYINEIAFTADGALLASGDTSGTVYLWDTATQRQVGAALHTANVLSLAFTPDGTTLATAGTTPAIRLWNTARVVGTPIRGHTGSINVVAYAPNGATIATAGDDRTLQFWNATTRDRIGDPLTGHTGPIIGVTYSPDGSLVATTSTDGTLRLWTTRTRELWKTIETEPGVYVSTAFSPNGMTLAIAGETGPVRLVRIDDGVSTPIADADNSFVVVPSNIDSPGPASVAVAFSPDGRRVAATYEDEVRLWDVVTHQQISKAFTGHGALPTALAFSPDGTKLATGSKDETIRLWDTTTHDLIGTPVTGHSGTVRALAFSRDGATLATVANDGVRLWDTATRQQIGTSLADAAEEVAAMAFSADDRTLATASGHGHVRLWNVTYLVDDLPRRLCTEAGRSLTREEWTQYVPPGPEFREICPYG